MRKRLLLVPMLAVLPAMATELGLLLDKQAGEAQTAAFGTGQKYDAVSPTGLGVRLGFDVLDLKVAALVAAGFFVGGLLGAKFAVGLSNATLEKVFGTALTLIGLGMILK